jgi:hypothetical protein
MDSGDERLIDQQSGVLSEVPQVEQIPRLVARGVGQRDELFGGDLFERVNADQATRRKVDVLVIPAQDFSRQHREDQILAKGDVDLDIAAARKRTNVVQVERKGVPVLMAVFAIEIKLDP